MKSLHQKPNHNHKSLHSYSSNSSKGKKSCERIKQKGYKTIDYLQKQIVKEQRLNSEQFACQQLKQQSWLQNSTNALQPDSILRITPRPTIHLPNPIPPSTPKLPQNRPHSKTQQSPQNTSFQNSHNTSKTHFPLFARSSQHRSSVPNRSLVGKQAICLTQYIVTGPSWHFSYGDQPRKLERSKYIRVLKQMKYRKGEKMGYMGMGNGGNKNGDRGLVKTIDYEVKKMVNKREQIEQFFVSKNNDLQKLFLSSQRVKKNRQNNYGRRGQSLRTSQNQLYKENPLKNKPIFI